MTLNRLVITGALIAAISFFSTLPANADFKHCKYHHNIERTVNIENVQFLNIVARAGELEIIGSDRDDIKINARLCSEEQDLLQQLDVSDKQQNKELHIETIFPEESFWGENAQSTIDLELRIPKRLMLTVIDSSGSVEVTHVASLKIRDSSGELDIEDIAGDVIVFDSSGALNVEKVDGSVTITDSSGYIKVDSIKENVTIEVDSSGAIEATNILGNVLIKEDSSGAIIADNIGGDFTVGKDSSGGIDYKDIKGRVDLPD